ncbi:ATP-binding protein [Pelomonas sp. KK5]|uniref:ATP-binding protein n=1 Tax=Pelomonas sp. KK5 TaxID=1855730 RepID=UPI001E3A31DC|nr:ATP-binding protein [Pelomonas sp. KK5]
MMIERLARRELRRRMGYFPGVVLLGPRQVGKSTLARAFAAEQPGAIVLDLERQADRVQLSEPELFLSRHRDRLVVLDEVQLMPELFSHLRPEIDAERRPGRFLLLGSASGTLLRQGSESLAGRVSYLELSPLLAAEAAPDLLALQSLWLRGGFPLSHLAPDEALSYQWRQDFIDSFLYRDLPQMGVGVPAATLHRFWRMQAHLQGQLFNASQLAVSLGGMAHTTVARYLDTLVDAMVLRRLEPVLPNLGKRLVKSPKVYVRDSGLLHALLGIADLDALQGHPIAGNSWEGFVIEQLAAALPAGAELGFYRTAAGAELDAVVTLGQRRLGFEIKFSTAPKVSRGFWSAAEDLQLDRAYVLAPVERAYPLSAAAEVQPISAIPALLA